MGCISTELSNVFDIVEHSIALEKMYHYGIRGNYLQLELFKSYKTLRR